jgi:DNA-binding CsgD family transcriptional regulator
MALWTGGARHTHGYTIGLLGGTLVESGALDAGEQLLARGGLVTGRSDAENFLRHSRVLVHLARGNREEALAAARELATAAAHVGNPAWLPWRTLLGSCFGPGEEARALAEEELELARRWGTASVVGRGLAALGSLEGEAGIPRLIEATELLAGAPARLEEARGLLALGRALRLARRPTDAREPLRRALELAESCGAGPLVDDVRGELYAAGARPRTSAQSGPASLTPSERRVAVMAAEGRTNREIAQALYVTPKTVEVHLSNAYRKLGVSSRRHLAGALPAPA